MGNRKRNNVIHSQTASVGQPHVDAAQRNCFSGVETKMLEASIEQLTTTQKEQLARQLGYPSIETMIAGSSFVTLADGSTWWLTKDRFGSWTAWNLCAFEAELQARELGERRLETQYFDES